MLDGSKAMFYIEELCEIKCVIFWKIQIKIQQLYIKWFQHIWTKGNSQVHIHLNKNIDILLNFKYIFQYLKPSV